MFRWAILIGLVGLVVATGVIIWTGWASVLQSLRQAGWGIAALAAFHALCIIVSSTGWWALVPGRKRPSLRLFFYFMWVRASINNLMPVARIGGEIAAVRLMTRYSMRKSTAIAATVVELTLSIVALFLFVLIGVGLFALRVNDHNITRQLIWALVLSMPLIAAFAAVQRIGFFKLLSRLFHVMFRDKWAAFAMDVQRIDRAVAALYRNHRRILACGSLQFFAWALGSVEIWLALQFLSAPLPFGEAFMIEALIQGSASAAFAVPGALGVQEAGFVLFGGLLGLTPGTAGALAVMRRCRDLLCYVPALVVWQLHEGKRLLRS